MVLLFFRATQIIGNIFCILRSIEWKVCVLIVLIVFIVLMVGL